jgi:hypothetical protein
VFVLPPGSAVFVFWRRPRVRLPFAITVLRDLVSFVADRLLFFSGLLFPSVAANVAWFRLLILLQQLSVLFFR